MSANSKRIEKAYALAREAYGAMGVDVEKALDKLAKIPISLHCWQGDDVRGFEASADGDIGGGLAVTGNYPGRARTVSELRSDLDKAYSLIPGKNHRLNLHSIYLDSKKPVDRVKIGPEHYKSWIDWAKAGGHGLDFNPTCFAHPKADSGFTLSSPDKGVREYWIEHCIACRKIGEAFGKALKNPCVTNIWIPDGYKDIPVDRNGARKRLAGSLDKILAAQVDRKWNLDSVESKLFGIGSESCVIGSHEFYMGYAMEKKILLCLDAGHFHPTEVISDKLSSVLLYLDEILLHVSRGVRWDSDHVVILTDELRAIAEEIVRNNFQSRVHIGLDFFDASINRVAAWTIGSRSMLKALLIALLEPTDQLRKLELASDFTRRLAMLEEMKTMPFAAVWDYYCLKQDAFPGATWIDEVGAYEKSVLSKRG
jgi:L-rhamnose isomerase